MVKVAIREPEPLVRWVRSRTVVRRPPDGFDGIGGPQMRPMLRGKVVKGKQNFFVFFQAFTGLWKLDLVNC
jgi:hypothetical protein